jgi:hypothetical protein
MNTGCSEFENLLAGLRRSSKRANGRAWMLTWRSAAHCRALAQTLSELGTALSAEYGDVRAPSSLLDRLGRRIPADPLPKPSLLPAILDMVAWSAVACAGGSVAWFVALPVITFTGTMLYATAGLLTLSGAGITLWAMRESED